MNYQSRGITDQAIQGPSSYKAEITAAEALLKDHPAMVTELEGYAEFVKTQLAGELEAALDALDAESMVELDAFREYMSDYVKKSYKDWNDDEDA